MRLRRTGNDARQTHRRWGAAIAATAVVASAVVLSTPAGANPGDVTTIAGGGTSLGALVGDANWVVVDGDTLYISDYWNYHVVARSVSTGDQEVYAGTTGVRGIGGNGGPATSAGFEHPGPMALDSQHNLYVWEWDETNGLCDIRRIDHTTHVVTKWAGNGCSDSGDGGDADAAGISWPHGMAFDSQDNLYLTDGGTTVRRIDHATHVIDVAAGTAGVNGYVDGLAPLSAEFNGISGIAFDASGNLLLVDTFNQAVRMIDAGFTTVSTVAGGSLSGNAGPGHDDGAVSSATFDFTDGSAPPARLAVAPSGAIAVADRGNWLIREISADRQSVSTIAGVLGSEGDSGQDGPAVSAQIRGVRGMEYGSNGFLHMAYAGGSPNVRYIDAGGIMRPGPNRAPALHEEPAVGAGLEMPIDLARVGQNLYVAEVGSGRIRRINLDTGTISPFAGTGGYGSSGDGGPALQADLAQPRAVAYDAEHNALVVVGVDARVRRISLDTNVITTIAGTGVAGFADGPALSAQISDGVTGVAVTPDGRLLIADSNNFRVRCLGCAGPGIMSTLAGDGVRGSSADGVAATAAHLTFPMRVVTAPDNSVVIADMCDVQAVLGPLMSGSGSPVSVCDSRVRRINPTTGVLETIAGIAGDTSGTGDGGPASAASIRGPIALRYDAAGNLYIGEAGGTYLELFLAISGMTSPTTVAPGIRMVDAHTGIISTVAGNGVGGFSGDGGPATAASFSMPAAIAPDAGTHLYVADFASGRVRRIEGFRPDLRTTITGGPFVVGQPGTLTITEHNAGGGYLTGPILASVTLPAGVTYTSASGTGWTCTATGQTVSCSNPSNLAPGETSLINLAVSIASDAEGTTSVVANASSDSDVVNPASQTYVLGIDITHAPLAAPTTTEPAAAAPTTTAAHAPATTSPAVVPDRLAATGSNAATPVTIAIGALGLGAVCVALGRRRRATT